jgi:hypothetical protein
MEIMKPKKVRRDFKSVFMKKGTCSHTLFYILNREFGYLKENEERASDPLAGGLIQTGHQCGMLWGSTLAVGAESFRRHDNRDQAIGAAITVTQHLVEAFSETAKSVNCREITGCDFTSKFGLLKAFLFGRFIRCFRLTDKWAPEAIRSAKEGLSRGQTDLPPMPISCASEVAQRMGASDEEMVMVAGFAGGIGLSGNACGALAAAIWMNTLVWCKKHPGKTPPYFNNPNTKNTLKEFLGATDSKILCHEITGQCFKTIDDHSEFIKNDGCNKLMNVLARS